MKKISIICLIFFTLLSLYASSISQKEIKCSPEHKFKLWLNDTVKHIKGKYTISYDSTLLTITDSFSYIVRKGKQFIVPIKEIQKLYNKCLKMFMSLRL